MKADPMNNHIPYAIAIHGGAGTLRKGTMSAELEGQYSEALKKSLDRGFEQLELGNSALDAVEQAVIELEDSPLFNTGCGSVFTADGTHEMDASIMDGASRQAGAVSLIQGIKNPVSLARTVMDQSDHVFLAGDGAMKFAKHHGFLLEDDQYFFDELRFQQWQEIKDSDQFQLDHSPSGDGKFGTVGAVALDQHGNLAAATSTGGMTNKRFGRIGDSPLIGAGTYANNRTCAVSCTGSGEFFIRAVAAYDVSCLIEHCDYSLDEASHEVIMSRLPKIDGDGGLIAVNQAGEVAMPFNTEGMYRACRQSNGKAIVAIYGDDQ